MRKLEIDEILELLESVKNDFSSFGIQILNKNNNITCTSQFIKLIHKNIR